MTTAVKLPEDVLYDLDMRVNAGEFATREEAAAYFIRRGLASGRDKREPGLPPRPPSPMRDLPDSEKPLNVDPTDVNWAP